MNLGEKRVHELIGAIYDGMADPTLWQQALVQLSDATRSVGAMLDSMDLVDRKQSRYALGRLDPGLTQLFLTRHARDSLWSQVAERTPAGAIFAVGAAVPPRDLVKTEFYSEMLQPQQILPCGATNLARDAAERWCGLDRAPFEYPLFGAGGRMRPGALLGHQMVKIALAIA